MADSRPAPADSRLVAAARKYEIAEFDSPRGLKLYAEAIRQLGTEMYLRQHLAAEEIQSRLSRYRGRWYQFGAASRVKARICAYQLRLGAEAARTFAMAGSRFAASLETQFLALEREARGGPRKRGVDPFRIDDDDL